VSTQRFIGLARLMVTNHNRVPDSEDLSQWTQSVGTVVVTAGVADPYGGLDARNANDDNVGTEEVIEESVSFASAGQKVLAVFVREASGSGGLEVTLRDTTAGVNRAVLRVDTFTAGNPNEAYSTGTKYFKRDMGNGWYRLAILSTAVTSANAHVVQIKPARAGGPATTGSVDLYGLMAVDAATLGGYVRTLGTAITGTTRSHDLALPLQGVRPATAGVALVGETLDRRVREVTTFGSVNEVIGEVRYDDEPESLKDVLNDAAKGHALVYLADQGVLDAGYELDLIEPAFPIADIPFDADQRVFDEHRIMLRLRQPTGQSLSALF